MEQLGVSKMLMSAEKKLGFLKASPIRFLVYSMMAGVFCGLGMILAYSASSALDYYEATRGFAKIAYGLSFTLSFTFIIYAGCELFTGDVGTIAMGIYGKKVSLKNGILLLILVYIGNLIGATAIAMVIGGAGLLENPITAQYMVSNCAAKMAFPFWNSFFRGVLCNMLVVLAIWSTSKLKSEPAKMVILFWCVYGFCTSGFEHSIANMALFAMSMISSYATVDISLAGYINNIIPVTLGNIVGGAFVIAGIYYFVGSAKENLSWKLDKLSYKNELEYAEK